MHAVGFILMPLNLHTALSKLSGWQNKNCLFSKCMTGTLIVELGSAKILFYYCASANAEKLELLRKGNQDLREARQCKLCFDVDINVVLLPCGHACTCASCATAVTHCPICRMFIRGTVKIALD